MTAPLITADDVLLACDMAVRMTLVSAAKRIRNHRGRADRGRYSHVSADDLYLALAPAATTPELDAYFAKWPDLGHLASVLDDAHVHRRTLYGQACQEYVRVCMTSQTPHDVANLRAYLVQVDQVTSS
ncbi:hypothetical protein [Gordonia sp. (in: high G+C Gram-positive bacteria)]|uniref:hypothetical protein n=1 Tax=Gordonia sp. (in: high G+C Gram-positive bacteria) TaxID=84139 RepID=UPI0026118179|nr:hypothetical protein [Gordonia sp. (in: high G+C Gram-positive bacteria)]